MERRRALTTQDELEGAIHNYTPKDFIAVLRGQRLAVIAEMKQRTPSMGVLSEDYRPIDLARAYTKGGAAAISVLTHMAGFGGRAEHVVAARLATNLPILRKDFITDPYEIGEARGSGADAVLLIVAALEARELRRLLAVARSRGLAALVEVHDEREVKIALVAESGIHSVEDARRLREAGADAILVGEMLMRAPDAAACLRELASL